MRQHLAVSIAGVVLGFACGWLAWGRGTDLQPGGAAPLRDAALDHAREQQPEVAPRESGPVREEPDANDDPGRFRSLPIDLFAYHYHAFNGFALDHEAATLLRLDDEESERVSGIYRSAIAQFSEARTERLQPTESGEPGIYRGTVAPFPDRVAEIRREMNGEFVEAIGFGRARQLSALSERAFRQDTYQLGRFREEVSIERRDGEINYKHYFYDPETGQMDRGGGVGGWSIEDDEEARAATSDGSQREMTLRATFQKLGLWPADKEAAAP